MRQKYIMKLIRATFMEMKENSIDKMRDEPLELIFTTSMSEKTLEG